jgi:hypothetical protein
LLNKFYQRSGGTENNYPKNAQNNKGKQTKKMIFNLPKTILLIKMPNSIKTTHKNSIDNNYKKYKPPVCPIKTEYTYPEGRK